MCLSYDMYGRASHCEGVIIDNKRWKITSIYLHSLVRWLFRDLSKLCCEFPVQFSERIELGYIRIMFSPHIGVKYLFWKISTSKWLIDRQSALQLYFYSISHLKWKHFSANFSNFYIFLHIILMHIHLFSKYYTHQRNLRHFFESQICKKIIGGWWMICNFSII